MELLADSALNALWLILHLDRELFEVVFTSLAVSGASTLLASLLGIPLGFIVASFSFYGKKILITLLNSLLALPTVVVGLFVYTFISRQGIFGPWDLLYTKKAIVMGQTILIVPLVATFTMAAVTRVDIRFTQTAQTLGASRWQTALVVGREAGVGIVAAVIAAFGRVIAEVGVSMMLGGNIKGFTRTMTTAMALEYDKGEFAFAAALGLILLLLCFALHWGLFWVYPKKTG